jgi:hypothetical protein
VHEFVSSWEKEIYELNNLDYFTFLLINHLGNHIEHGFFSEEHKYPYLRINPDEIATLAFNIGDGLESFFENNCFGDCSLNCPIRLDEKIDPEEADLAQTHLNIMQIMSDSNMSKKQFLLTDILNYVVLDTLYDFYNYEVGLELDDADDGLMQFADSITMMLEKFIETRGQTLLANPRESAVEQFENIISESEENWDEKSSFSDDDSEDEEEWRHGAMGINTLVQQYITQSGINSGVELRLLEYFTTYTREYANILQMDDLSPDDLAEFFFFWLLREISLEKEIQVSDVINTFGHLFLWMDLSYNVNLKEAFDRIINEHFGDLQRALNLGRSYFDKNSLINGLLEANVEDDKIVSGFFEVEKISANGLLRLKDIHFKETYLNVKINLTDHSLLENLILYASLKLTIYGWRVINLDYVFPEAARPYLH